MPRWERRGAQGVEYWELLEGEDGLTERWGAAQEPVRSRSQRVPHAGTREAIMERMRKQREAQGFVRCDPAEPAPALPLLEGYTEAQRDAVLRSVRRVDRGDAYAYRRALEAGGVEWKAQPRVAWELLRAGLVDASSWPGYWAMLAEFGEDFSLEGALALLERIPRGRDFDALFPGGEVLFFAPGTTHELDALLARAWLADRARVEAFAPRLSPGLRLDLAFVRARHGERIEPAQAEALLAHAARAHARGGLASNRPLLREGVSAEDSRLRDDAAVAALLEPLRGADAWYRALLAETFASQDVSLWRAGYVLERCDAEALARLLARAGSFHTSEELAKLLALLARRGDAPAALLAAARGLDAGERHARAVAEMLALVALPRAAEVPAGVEDLLRFEFVSTVYRPSLAVTVAGLRALPRERALALCRARLAEPYAWHTGLVALEAHFDEELLQAFLARDEREAYLDPGLLAGFAPRVLPELQALWERTPREARGRRERQLLAAMGALGEAGAVVDPALERFVRFDEEGHEALKYWDNSMAEARARALRALSPERRAALVLRCAREGRYPERTLGVGSVLEDAALLEVLRACLARGSEASPRELAYALFSLGARGSWAAQEAWPEVRAREGLEAALRELFPSSALPA